MNYILASASPRRKELLKVILPKFDTLPTNIEEKPYLHLTPKQRTVQLSKDKCRAALNICGAKNNVIIASDTVVELNDKVFEKPKDKKHAFNMIKQLSGKKHMVHTGVTVYKSGVLCSFAQTTCVYVGDIPDNVIEKYVETPEPYDKAGGYAIQGFMAGYIEKIEGDYHNVVGLPICKLNKLLKKMNAL